MSEVKVIVTVDRIEGENAVLLLPKTGGELPVHWPVSLLPPGVGEGSKIKFTLSEDHDTETEARQRVADLLQKLTRRDNNLK
ncbi:MAG: DUF3006 domain-containing protein [Firmicutes bacterium]|jgi:hypothetical protein|nr:DUF3006 domain-containing protein [Bacillota bacterium]